MPSSMSYLKGLERSLDAYNVALLDELDRTNHEPLFGWLPYKGYINEKRLRQDASRRAFYLDTTAQADGYMGDLKPGSHRASNVILVGLVVRNGEGDNYFHELRLVSPVACSIRGRRPLTLRYWRRFIQAAIESRIQWQVLPGFYDYDPHTEWFVDAALGWKEQPKVLSFIGTSALSAWERGEVAPAIEVNDREDKSRDYYGWPGDMYYRNSTTARLLVPEERDGV